MPLHLTVRTKGPAPGQGQTSEHAAVTEGEPDASDAALCRLRRQAASLLRERFELDPQRYAEEGMEAVLHLLRSGEREDALELLRHIGQKLATAPSVVVHREPIRSTAAAPAKKAEGRRPLRLRDAQRFALRRGIALHHQGDMLGARRFLQDSQLLSAARDEQRLASLTGYYLGKTQLALGDLEGALATTEATLKVARRFGAPFVIGFVEVLHAQVLLHAFQPAAARAQALRIVSGSRLPPRLRAAAYCVLAKAQALHRDLQGMALALSEMDAAVGEGISDRWEFDVEFVEIALLGAAPRESQLTELVVRAERASQQSVRSPQRYAEARSALALATALLLRGRAETEEVERIDEALGRGQELCAQHAYGFLHLRAVLLEAALLRRRGEQRRAQSLLSKGLDSASLFDDNLELRLLRGAVSEKDEENGAFTSGAILSLLGLRSFRPYEILDRTGSRDADEGQRQRAFAVHDLIIESERGIIARGGGGASISGRPLMAALMAALLAAGDEGVSAERLFLEVWGGREYHPLRHRNTVYVAINRLRQLLRELLPGREIVETANNGWRLGRDVDICAIRAKRSS